MGVDRTGWSWGCSTADFDNDGFPDLAIANGHETRASVREYEPEFWLHDLYAANSTENPVVAMYFAAKFQRTRGQGQSYGGRELNRLFLNQRGRGFVEAAHLLGVALDADTRNLATGDLDGDGRPDLVLTTFEAWPERRQTLRVFRNELPAQNWLAVQLRPAAAAPAVAGARVAVRLSDGREVVQALVAGDSHRVQHPDVLHFGLGSASAVQRVRVRWTGGAEETLTAPALNRVHRVTKPRRGAGQGGPRRRRPQPQHPSQLSTHAHTRRPG
jgi:hypothetical protein